MPRGKVPAQPQYQYPSSPQSAGAASTRPASAAWYSSDEDVIDEITKVSATLQLDDLTYQTLADALKRLGTEAQVQRMEDGKRILVTAPPAELEYIIKLIGLLQNKPVAGNPRSTQADPSGLPALPRTKYMTAPVVQGRAVQPAYDYPPAYGTSSAAALKRAPPDPEMAKLEEADAAAGKKVSEIVKQLKAAGGNDQEAELSSKLKQAVDEHFAVRQAKRELELSRLEARLEKIRETIAKRNEVREEIVNRHISELLGEADELAF
jgi:hypothetical protein